MTDQVAGLENDRSEQIAVEQDVIFTLRAS